MSEMTTTELESYLAEARIADLVTLYSTGLVSIPTRRIIRYGPHLLSKGTQYSS